MTVIHVKSHQRRKSTPVTYLDTTEALYPLGLQHLLAKELEEVLSEPLDALDAPEEQKQRILEPLG